MGKIKTNKGEMDLGELVKVPNPMEAAEMLLPEAVFDDILLNCERATIDEIGRVLIEFGNALQVVEPPSLRLDFSVVDSGTAVVGKLFVQGHQSCVIKGQNLADIVASTVRSAAEQGAYHATDDPTRIVVLGKWSRALLGASRGLDDTANAMLAAGGHRQMRRDEQDKAIDADRADGKNVDG